MTRGGVKWVVLPETSVWVVAWWRFRVMIFLVSSGRVSQLLSPPALFGSLGQDRRGVPPRAVGRRQGVVRTGGF